MKLIIFIFLIFFETVYNYSSYRVVGKLNKYQKIKIYTNEAIYLDLDEFKDVQNIYFNITLFYGYFTDSNVYYGGTNGPSPASDINLYNYKTYQSESYGTRYEYNNIYYYDRYTYIFEIPKINNKYLYVTPPKFMYLSNYHIMIENFNPSRGSSEPEGSEGNGGSEIVQQQKEGGLSVGAIIGIVIAALVVISGLKFKII